MAGWIKDNISKSSVASASGDAHSILLNVSLGFKNVGKLLSDMILIRDISHDWLTDPSLHSLLGYFSCFLEWLQLHYRQVLSHT